MSIFSLKNIISLNEDNYLNEDNSLNEYKLNKYYFLKLRKYTVAGCKVMP